MAEHIQFSVASNLLSNLSLYDVQDSEIADWLLDHSSLHRYYYQPHNSENSSWKQPVCISCSIRFNAPMSVRDECSFLLILTLAFANVGFQVINLISITEYCD